MFTKDQFIASLTHETKVIKHLLTQIPAGKWDFRPTPGQRSTLELARYLTIVGSAATTYALTQAWDHWDALDASTKTLEGPQFAKALDRQVKGVVKALAATNDAALRRKQIKTWSGTPSTLGVGLIEMVLKSMTAYRMQLFLYAKQSGAEQLGTSDCWAGKAAKKPKAKAAAAG